MKIDLQEHMQFVKEINDKKKVIHIRAKLPNNFIVCHFMFIENAF